VDDPTRATLYRLRGDVGIAKARYEDIQSAESLRDELSTRRPWPVSR
jgi:hypothetical protein